MMINSRLTNVRFLAGFVLCLAFLFQSGPAAAQAVSNPSEIAPDVAILVSGMDEERVSAVTARLAMMDGVARATTDTASDGRIAFYLAAVESGGNSRPSEAIGNQARDVILAVAPDAEVLVGGSDLVSETLTGRFRTSAVWVSVLALLIGGVLGAAFGGWKRAVTTAAALFLAVLFAGSFGAQIGGDFDGTFATTAVPGALAGMVVAVAVALRLLLWFRHPAGVDGAETLRRSVAELLPELALVLSGLAITAVIIEFFDPGRSPLTVVAVSAAVAILVVLAILAPALTVLEPPPVPGGDSLPASFPDGRDFPLIVVAAIAAVLVALSLFAFGSPSPILIGADALDASSEQALVAEGLSPTGDPTNALIAVKPEPVEPIDFQGWAGAVAERSEVAYVDTSAGRVTSLGRAEVDQATLLVPADRDDVAVIVLSIPPRSEEGQQVAARLAAIPLAGGPPDLEGEASEVSQIVGSRSTLVAALLVLAGAAAGALYVMTQNVALTATAFFLRLIGGGASLGLLRLMIGDVTVSESLTVLAVMALGIGLFELEFLRGLTDLEAGPFGRWQRPPDSSATGELLSGVEPPIDANPGQNAVFAMIALGLSGLALSFSALAGGGPGTGQFGLGLLTAVVIEVLIGLILLRPALLGQRAAFHTAVRPVRIAMHSGIDRSSNVGFGTEDPVWRRTVADLLQAEFRLQSEPHSAELESVFVPDTPLYKQAEVHHGNLGDANLRIVGRSPQLRTLKTASGRSPISLAVTVDHPARHLVDEEGTVVGVRKPERRSGVLWLSSSIDGSYRIAESVELGSVPLPEEDPGAEPGETAPDETGELYIEQNGDGTADDDMQNGDEDPAATPDGGGADGTTSPSEPLAP